MDTRRTQSARAAARQGSDLAARYIDLGWPLVPIGVDLKPFIDPAAATTDPDTLASWLEDFPDAGLAVVLPERLFALEAPPRRITELIGRHPNLRYAPRFETPAGTICFLVRSDATPAHLEGVRAYGPGDLLPLPPTETADGRFDWVVHPRPEALPSLPTELKQLDGHRRDPEPPAQSSGPADTEAALQKLLAACKRVRELPITDADRAKGVVRKWQACCPAHDDQRPSLSIALMQDGKILLHCHAGCRTDDVCRAAGLTMADLFPPGSGDGAPPRRVVAEYVYQDARGRPYMMVRRFANKEFDQLRYESGEWVSGLSGREPILYRLPEVLKAIEAGRVIFVAEGEKDVETLRKLGFVATCNPMGAGAWRDTYTEALTGAALVVILPDADAAGVDHALAVARSLHAAGIRCKLIEPFYGGPGSKRDITNAIEEGLTADELKEIVRGAPDFNGQAPAWTREYTAWRSENGKFAVREGGFARFRGFDKDGAERWDQLSNFTARIVEEIEEDDGVETRRAFVVRGWLHSGRRLPPLRVPASDFAGLSWVLEWSGEAIVEPGFGAKDALRAAIQHFSVPIPRRRVFRHTGWRRIDGRWLYLHAGGAIGAAGPVAGVETALEKDLAGFRLPDPPAGARLRESVEAALKVLEVAPPPVAWTLLAAAARAPLGEADFSIHLGGDTGVGKTTVAALVQQFFGPELHDRNLPGNWQSTGNSLELLGFHVKDAVLVVDDFVPSGTSRNDVDRLHREAARVLRTTGNRSGRRRATPDGGLREEKPVRSLILSTGEDLPAGKSLRARLWIVELQHGDVDWQAVSVCKQLASEGCFAEAMAAYVHHLAERFDAAGTDPFRLLREERDKMASAFEVGGHKRTPRIAADLMQGLRYFLAFAAQVGAIDEARRQEFERAAYEALRQVAARQAEYIGEQDPVAQFLGLIAAAIAAGEAHLTTREGHSPENARIWGWSWRGHDLEPQGRLLGFVEGSSVFLIDDVAFALAQELARRQGTTLPITKRTLRRRLRERRLLLSTGTETEGRESVTVRRSFGGRRLEMLHLPARVFVDRIESMSGGELPDQPDQQEEKWPF